MKSLSVPYFKQSTNYTCGPASLRMVLSYFDVKTNEKTLAEDLETNSDIGTMHHNMIEGVRRAGLYCYVNDQATIQELRYLLGFGAPVIIRFVEPSPKSEDHYGVVVGVNRFFITIHDPWHGPYQRYTHKSFSKRWRCDEIGTCAQWLMAVSKTALPLGRQYNPIINE